jgi:hypothetical protein
MTDNNSPQEISNGQMFFTLCNIGANMLMSDVARLLAIGAEADLAKIPLDRLQWASDYAKLSATMRQEQKDLGDTDQDDHIARCIDQANAIDTLIDQRTNPNLITVPTKPKLSVVKRGISK